MKADWGAQLARKATRGPWLCLGGAGRWSWAAGFPA